MSAYGIMFHHFYNSMHPKGQGAVSADDLVSLIHHFGEDRILGAEEWTERAIEGRLGEKDICFTFDDGLRCQFDVAFPVLDDFGITAFWFIYSSVYQDQKEPLEVYRYFRTAFFDDINDFYNVFFDRAREMYPDVYDKGLEGFVPETYLAAYSFYGSNDRTFRYIRDVVFGIERYNKVMQSIMEDFRFSPESITHLLWMNDDHLRILHKAGNSIGLHSFSHPMRMNDLQVEVQFDEYQRNYNHILSVLGTPPRSMSHPCNSYEQDTLDILKEMEIRVGFRANQEVVENASGLEFPRENHTDVLEEIRKISRKASLG
jgi:peptidoglycan/xylan/chitin deacetylase (PgdA/CDA1 family)